MVMQRMTKWLDFVIFAYSQRDSIPQISLCSIIRENHFFFRLWSQPFTATLIFSTLGQLGKPWTEFSEFLATVCFGHHKHESNCSKDNGALADLQESQRPDTLDSRPASGVAMCAFSLPLPSVLWWGKQLYLSQEAWSEGR